MHRILIVLLAFALVACGPRLPPRSAVVQSAAPQVRAVTGAPSVQVVAQNFGDLDPTDWQGRPPQRHPVHGIDVSVWQGDIDFAAARANGVNFVFMKATEGGDRADPNFARNWQAAGMAGVPRGAYHLFYHCRSAAEQARWYIDHVPRSTGALPPVLDMEWTPTSPTCRTRQPLKVVRAEAQVFVNIVAAHYGRQPILYTTLDFFHDNDMGRLTGVSFWLRSVAAPLERSHPGQPWTFWQYSSTGQVRGISGTVDLNAFSGSKAAWAAFVAN